MPDIDVMLHKAALRVREGTLPDGRHLRYAAETVNGVTVPGMGTIEFLPEYQQYRDAFLDRAQRQREAQTQGDEDFNEPVPNPTRPLPGRPHAS